MKKAKFIVRILLGLMVLIFGLNKFLQFMPMPPMPEAAGDFMGALIKSGYLMEAVAIVEIVTGLMLLFNRFQPLALILLFPVLLNAFWFHLFLDPAGIAAAAVLNVLIIFLFFVNKDKYAGILEA